MKTLLFFFGVLLAGASAGASEPAHVFFPPHVAGGTLKLFSSGAIIFTGNGWSSSEPGRTTLRLEWQDEKRPERMVFAYWTFDIPPGRFEIAAERKDESIIFSLRTRWLKKVVRRSEPFPIETFEKAKPIWLPMSDESIHQSDAVTRPNQSPEPTALSVTICACAQLAPASTVAHL